MLIEGVNRNFQEEGREAEVSKIIVQCTCVNLSNNKSIWRFNLKGPCAQPTKVPSGYAPGVNVHSRRKVNIVNMDVQSLWSNDWSFKLIYSSCGNRGWKLKIDKVKSFLNQGTKSKN